LVANSKYWLGEIESAHYHSANAIALYTDELGERMIEDYGLDIIVIAQMFAVWTSHLLGRFMTLKNYKEQTYLSTKKAHPFSVAIAQTTLSWQAHHEQDVEATLREATILKDISEKGELKSYSALADIFLGWAKGHQSGNFDKGMEQMAEGARNWLITSGDVSTTYFLILSSEFLNSTNQINQIEAQLTSTITYANKTKELAYEAELWRIKGEVLEAKSNDKTAAIEAYKQGLQVACDQKAKTLELKILSKLIRLEEGKNHEVLLTRFKALVEEINSVDKIKLITNLEEVLNVGIL